MVWTQNYDPMQSLALSTICAAAPVVVMLVSLGLLHVKAHVAAGFGLVTALLIAVFIFGMPVQTAGLAAAFGGAYGLLPIGWIVLNIIFLHRLTEENGLFGVLQRSIAGITDDRRLQLLLIAFSFGAFFEGAAGFGTPVAVTGAILIGLGFSPLAASGLALIANTAPVAFGALGAPVLALSAVTGLDLLDLSGMIGRQLPFFSLLVPFWLIWAFAGFRGMIAIWPAILVTGLSFAVTQYAVSNFHGPWLVDVVASIVSMVCLVRFLKVWKPAKVWTSAKLVGHNEDAGVVPLDRPHGAIVGIDYDTIDSDTGPTGAVQMKDAPTRQMLFKAWAPWAILTVFVFLWGVPAIKASLDGLSVVKIPVAGLNQMVQRMPPVVTKPTLEAAVFNLNWLSATGTGILLAAIIGGLFMGYKPGQLVGAYGRTIYRVRYSLLTIVLMLALGTLTRFSGLDTTLGLAFAHTGVAYPMFGVLLGWMGVAVTGSDTASNVLFGGLQKTTAEQLGISPLLMSAANSSGGVMGKMIDAQSIVVASTATGWKNGEGPILRYVFFHSIALAVLVGVLVTLQAYVWPFTALVPK